MFWKVNIYFNCSKMVYSETWKHTLKLVPYVLVVAKIPTKVKTDFNALVACVSTSNTECCWQGYNIYFILVSHRQQTAAELMSIHENCNEHQTNTNGRVGTVKCSFTNSVNWRRFITGCWREYLDPRGRKQQSAGKNSTIKSFILCTLRQIWLGCSN
jgi:hypothetical protein